MARKVEVQLIDDIDGGPAVETVRFGLDGTMYEIDLSAKRAGKLRTDLQKFVNAARRVHTPRVATGRRGSARVARVDPAQNKAIRQWAKRKRIKLSDRGRIPRAIIEQYEAQAGR